MEIWQPTASIDTLRIRANTLKKVRNFFAERDVLEVETPLLSPYTVTDPYLHSLWLSNKKGYLQTSPEYAMKRLLAAGSGSIYQICKAFRDDEQGRRHNSEFTMLEWYRVGFDHHRLMDEMDDLLQVILQCNKAMRIPYRQLFQQQIDIDIASISVEELQAFAEHKQVRIDASDLDKDTWLDILLSHLIEPQLGLTEPCFIYDYPASQSALAKVRQEDYPVAERFEVYINGIELANGFHELLDAKEQQQRFITNQQQRLQLGLPSIEIDPAFIAALESGLPACAGVALGFDRLMMVLAGKDTIAEVMAFGAPSCIHL